MEGSQQTSSGSNESHGAAVSLAVKVGYFLPTIPNGLNLDLECGEAKKDD
jgi:hypothetical protein